MAAVQRFLAFVNNKLSEIVGVQMSAGAANAGQLPALNPNGQIDSSMLPIGAAADIQADTAGKLVSADALWTAQSPITVPYSSSIALNFAVGLNFNIAALAGNLTLANPANPKAGQSGFIQIPQDSTGSRTIAFGSAWKFAGGTPTASTAASTVDGISYYVVDAAAPILRCVYAKAFA